MKYANISNIGKKKGDKTNIDNYRGIFIVNFYISLLLKFIYQNKKNTIDSSMTDFRIGWKKGTKCQRPFIHCSWNNARSPRFKSKPINIIIADFTQCFDGLNLPLACKDIYESGFKDDFRTYLT